MGEYTLEELKIICMNTLRRSYIQNTYMLYEEEAEVNIVAAAYIVCNIILGKAEQLLKKQKTEHITRTQVETLWAESLVEYAKYGNAERVKLAAESYNVLKSEMNGFDNLRKKVVDC